MPRMSYEQMRDSVRDIITNGGGSVTHAALIDALGRDAAGIGRQLPAMVANGDIYAKLTTSPDAPPVLRYYVQTAPTAPSGGDAS